MADSADVVDPAQPVAASGSSGRRDPFQRVPVKTIERPPAVGTTPAWGPPTASRQSVHHGGAREQEPGHHSSDAGGAVALLVLFTAAGAGADAGVVGARAGRSGETPHAQQLDLRAAFDQVLAAMPGLAADEIRRETCRPTSEGRRGSWSQSVRTCLFARRPRVQVQVAVPRRGASTTEGTTVLGRLTAWEVQESTGSFREMPYNTHRLNAVKVFSEFQL